MLHDLELGTLPRIDLTGLRDRFPAGESDFCLQIYQGEPLYDQLRDRILPPVNTEEHAKWTAAGAAQGVVAGSADGTSQIVFSPTDRFSGRVNIAACHGQAAFTLTIRLSNGQRTPGRPKRRRPLDPNQLRFSDWHPIQNARAAAAIWDKVVSDFHPKFEPKSKTCLEPIPMDGLLVIAGSTKSGKSELMKAVVNHYATAVTKSSKPAHLLTCEDPIEQWLPREAKASGAQGIGAYFRERSIIYTPRSLNKDVASVAQALKDAKRQTPACYVVGEVRKAEDWLEVIDFASTGHLVVATTHASSVRETILRIFKALKVRRAQERRMVANALLAVIHAELIPIDYTSQVAKKLKGEKAAVGLAQLPMLWHRTPSSVNQLTVDGLSSVLPNQQFCLSREQFLEHMIFKDLIAPAEVESTPGKLPIKITAGLNTKWLQTVARTRDIDELRKP